MYQTIFIIVPTSSQTITFNFIACTDGDGNNYAVVQIGTQVWMAENLKTTKYRDATSIPNVTDNTEWNNLLTGGYCNYNNTNNSDTINTYGHLYNWYAATDAHNIAPTGWHMPTDAEWTTLTTYLSGESVAGGKLKENCSTHWNSPNTGATNETGFTALPGGYRNYSGIFDNIGYLGYWWSSTEYWTSYSWYRTVYYSYSYVYRNYNFKHDGFSVRCVRD